MFGNHVIRHWSSTQSLIALSAGEIKYDGCFRACSQALGLRSMLSGLGVTEKRLRIKMDAGIPKSLASRRGLRGFRQVEVNQLWLQDKVYNGEIEIEKVMGIIIRADALTKPKDGMSLLQHLEWIGREVNSGRHVYAPELTKVDPFEDNNDDRRRLKNDVIKASRMPGYF